MIFVIKRLDLFKNLIKYSVDIKDTGTLKEECIKFILYQEYLHNFETQRDLRDLVSSFITRLQMKYQMLKKNNEEFIRKENVWLCQLLTSSEIKGVIKINQNDLDEYEVEEKD